MTKSSHELLLLTLRGTSRYRVAETNKLCDGIADVTVIAGDCLDISTYAATYQVVDNRAAGSFAVNACRSSVEQIRFVGTFMRKGVVWV